MSALVEQAVCSYDSEMKTARPKKVLIVDESEEARDVLSTVLERRGVQTFTASVSRRGAKIAREQKPDLVVFDVDSAPASPRQAFDSFTRDGEIEDAPIMAIGSCKFTVASEEGEFISKPYHVSLLLEKIERFLQGAGKVVEADGDDSEVCGLI